MAGIKAGLNVGTGNAEASPIANFTPGVQNRETVAPPVTFQPDEFKVNTTVSDKTGVSNKAVQTTKDEKFKQSYKAAQSGKGGMTFKELAVRFPFKADEIKKTRIAGLSGPSQTLINTTLKKEIDFDIKDAQENGDRPDTMGVIFDFFVDIVEREEEAKENGIEVDKILDIVGITKEQVLNFAQDNPPDATFMQKIKAIIPILMGPIADPSGIGRGLSGR